VITKEELEKENGYATGEDQVLFGLDDNPAKFEDANGKTVSDVEMKVSAQLITKKAKTN